MIKNSKRLIISGLILLGLIFVLIISMLNRQTPGTPKMLREIGKNQNLQTPIGVAVDNRTGQIFIADSGAARVVVYNRNGDFTFSFGEKGFGDGQFEKPYGLVITRKNTLLVSDPPNRTIQEFTLEGKFIRRLFYGSDGTIPGFMASGDNFTIVSDLAREEIIAIDAQGAVKKSLVQPGIVQHPQGVAIDSKGNIWAVDEQASDIKICTADGKLLKTLALTENRQKDLARGLAIDGFDRVWVSFPLSNRVIIYNSEGQKLYTLDANNRLSLPTGICVDNKNQAYIVNQGKNSLQVWSGVQ